MHKYLIICLTAIVAVAMGSCSNSPKFHVNGKISDADSSVLYLESLQKGIPFVVDSVVLNSDGDFNLSAPAPEIPQIYRMRIGSQFVHIPIDSIETITLTSSGKTFGKEYELAGSPAAERLAKSDKLIENIQKIYYNVRDMFAAGKVSRDQIMPTIKVQSKDKKKELSGLVLEDPASIVAYYIVFKSIAGGMPLYDPADIDDNKIIRAVATGFDTHHPTDPRTDRLKQITLSGARPYNVNAPKDTLQAREVGIIDFKLNDVKGNTVSLSKEAAKGKVIILNFTSNSEEYSGPFNIKLKELYSKYQSRGVEIIQVGIDPDEHQWRLAASNMPWISLYEPRSLESPILSSYGLQGIPTSFIIGRDGNIKCRADGLESIESNLIKQL